MAQEFILNNLSNTSSNGSNIDNCTFLAFFFNFIFKELTKLIGEGAHSEAVDVDMVENLGQTKILVKIKLIDSCIVDQNRKIVFLELRQHLINIFFLALEGQVSHDVLYAYRRIFGLELCLSYF